MIPTICRMKAKEKPARLMLDKTSVTGTYAGYVSGVMRVILRSSRFNSMQRNRKS